MNRIVASATVACIAGAVVTIVVCACAKKQTEKDTKAPPENLPEEPNEQSEGSHAKIATKTEQEIYFGCSTKTKQKDGTKTETEQKDGTKTEESESDDFVPLGNLAQSQMPTPSGPSVTTNSMAGLTATWVGGISGDKI